MFIHMYFELVLELKSTNETMIKNIKTINFGYENKTFQKSKYFFSYSLECPCSTMV